MRRSLVSPGAGKGVNINAKALITDSIIIAPIKANANGKTI